MLFRAAVAAIALALVTAVTACASAAGEGDDLLSLAAAVPADLAARGLLLQRDAEGHGRLLAALDLEPEDVRATLTTGAPAVRLLRTGAGADVTAALDRSGFLPQEGPAGWQLLARPDGAAGLAGIPAVAVGPDVVAVGSLEELRAVAVGDGAFPALPAEALRDAATALLRPGAQASAGDLPPFDAAVLSVGADGMAGHLALQLPAAGTQEDAVALAVRMRTAGPLTAGGGPRIEPVAPRTEGDVVSVALEWLPGAEPPAATLRAGLGSGLLDFLDG